MKKRAQYFLERDLVHVIASDMHNLIVDHLIWKKPMISLLKKYSEDKARELFKDNPRKIIMDQLI